MSPAPAPRTSSRFGPVHQGWLVLHQNLDEDKAELPVVPDGAQPRPTTTDPTVSVWVAGRSAAKRPLGGGERGSPAGAPHGSGSKRKTRPRESSINARTGIEW
jgi:hypothetical protein